MPQSAQRISPPVLSDPVNAPMTALDDETRWIEQSRQGDHEAFAMLIKGYQRMIHSLAYRMTGSLADAEDLAQEAFIQAYQQLDRFRGDARFSSWLYRIAVNRCLNWKKREARRERLHTAWSSSRESFAATTEPDPRSQRVSQALLRLPAKQRAAIVLTVYDGMNHAEAARVLGCSETTISWRIFAARKQLKRWLKSEAQADE
jgi:RNA polymerase sigma-70 factor, ECF subfamily